jgi:hypothetical protein
MRRRLLALLLVASLSACATYQPLVPAQYSGPTAVIGEDGHYEDASKGQLFYVEAVDGVQVESGLILTRRATYGMGSRVILKYGVHRVPAKPLKIKLVGTHVTGAPIHEMASKVAGTFFSVEGEVAFTPQADGAYFVTGTLEKGRSSVWIADVKTKERVSAVVNEAR